MQRYLDLLNATFMVRQLLAWHENIGKRQVKVPKVYLRDSGLLDALLGLEGGRPRVSSKSRSLVRPRPLV